MTKSVTVLTTVGVLVLGSTSGFGPVTAGVCLLVLSAPYATTCALTAGLWNARAGETLFALGALAVVFGLVPGPAGRLAGGAAVVLVLFALGAIFARRAAEAARTAVVIGHAAAIALALTAVFQAWNGNPSTLAVAVIPLTAIYAFMPRLRGATAFRAGAATWVSLLVLFGLAAYRDTPYREYLPVVAAMSFAWLALGYTLRRRKAAWSIPLYACAALLAGFCGAASLFSASAEGYWRVFLVNGVVFASLLLILRKDIFAYLVTLSLALMAYDWVKASTTLFTQDVLFYLVIGIAVLGVFFVLPYLKNLVVRLGLLPMFAIFTWRGAGLLSVPVAGVTVLVLSVYSVKISEHPKFCSACHYMGSCYSSWQYSSHKDVACVKCHYEPGVNAEIKGKLQGMVQLVKYVLTCCATCYSRLKQANHEVGADPELKRTVSEIIEEPCEGNVRVLHITEVLPREVGTEAIAAGVEKPLRGLKVACYYGCLMARMPEGLRIDHAEYPSLMDDLMRAAGAHPLEWPYKTECCGAALTLARQRTVVRLSGQVLAMAKESGADVLAIA